MKYNIERITSRPKAYMVHHVGSNITESLENVKMLLSQAFSKSDYMVSENPDDLDVINIKLYPDGYGETKNYQCHTATVGEYVVLEESHKGFVLRVFPDRTFDSVDDFFNLSKADKQMQAYENNREELEEESGFEKNFLNVVGHSCLYFESHMTESNEEEGSYNAARNVTCMMDMDGIVHALADIITDLAFQNNLNNPEGAIDDIAEMSAHMMLAVSQNIEQKLAD